MAGLQWRAGPLDALLLLILMGAVNAQQFPSNCRDCTVDDCLAVPRAEGGCDACICNGLLMPDCNLLNCTGDCVQRPTPDGCTECLCADVLQDVCPPIPACPSRCQIQLGSGCPECTCPNELPSQCPVVTCPSNCQQITGPDGCSACQCPPEDKVCPELPACALGCIDLSSDPQHTGCLSCNCTIVEELLAQNQIIPVGPTDTTFDVELITDSIDSGLVFTTVEMSTVGNPTPIGNKFSTLGNPTPTGNTFTTLGDTTPTGNTFPTMGDTTPTGNTFTTLGDTTPTGNTFPTLGDTTPTGNTFTTSGDTTPTGNTFPTLVDTTPTGNTFPTLVDTTTTGNTFPTLRGTTPIDVIPTVGSSIPNNNVDTPVKNTPPNGNVDKPVGNDNAVPTESISTSRPLTGVPLDTTASHNTPFPNPGQGQTPLPNPFLADDPNAGFNIPIAPRTGLNAGPSAAQRRPPSFNIPCGETSCPPGCTLCIQRNSCGRCLCGNNARICAPVPACRPSCISAGRDGCFTCACPARTPTQGRPGPVVFSPGFSFDPSVSFLPTPGRGRPPFVQFFTGPPSGLVPGNHSPVQGHRDRPGPRGASPGRLAVQNIPAGLLGMSRFQIFA